MNPEAWRIMRALVTARRECDKELANRRGYNARLYWAARRRSLTDALLIVRGRAATTRQDAS
jgi:hypothetical protein